MNTTSSTTPSRARPATAVVTIAVLSVAAAAVTLMGARGSSDPDPTRRSEPAGAAIAFPGPPELGTVPSHRPAAVLAAGSLPSRPDDPSTAAAHAQSRPLPADVARRVADLEARLELDGDDLESRHALARALLDAESWVDAFHQGLEITRRRPGDPDGVWVVAAVRLRMGQTRLALADLESLVRDHPDHVDGLHALGLARLRVGDSAGAVEAWEQGLAASSGRHPEIDRLLNVSRAARRERATGS